MKKLGFLLAHLLLVGCVSPASDVASLQNKGHGAIVFRQSPAATSEAVGIFVAEFDASDRSISPIDKPWTDRRLNKWESIWDEDWHYKLAWLEPGTYVIRSFHQQDKWELCFHEDAMVIVVEPGDLSYLGKLQVDKYTASLLMKVMMDEDRDLVKFGDVTSSYYFDGVPRLEFGSTNADEVRRVGKHTEKSI
jgi:hypothetical protein